MTQTDAPIGAFIGSTYGIKDPADDSILTMHCNIGIAIGGQHWVARGVPKYGMNTGADAIALFQSQPQIFAEFDPKKETL